MAKRKKVVEMVPLSVVERRLTEALVEAYTHRMGVREYVYTAMGRCAGERIVERAQDTIVKRIAEGGFGGFGSMLTGRMFDRAESAQHVACRVE